MEHTKEPWFWSDRYGEICYVSQEDDQSFGMQCPVDLKDEAILRRIVACVNACEGISTDALEGPGKHVGAINMALCNEIANLHMQRGQLAEALRGLLTDFAHTLPECESVQKARAALEAIK